MSLKELLLSGHSKAITMRIIQTVGSSQERFDELFALFTGNDKLIAQRAAWAISYAAMAHPGLIQPHFKKLLDNLESPGLHTAIKRNTIRLLQDVSIPKKYQGRVMDVCFNYISDPAEAVAVKAFSMTVLQKLAAIYPEINNELITIIEERWDTETAAFRSRAKKILNQVSGGHHGRSTAGSDRK
jgi:hypothetical protein